MYWIKKTFQPAFNFCDFFCRPLEGAGGTVLGSVTFVISRNEAQDVVMSEHDGLINLGLAEPRPLVPGGEDLDSHVLSSPLSSPNLTEATFPDALLEDDGPRYRSLDQQWKP